MNLKRIITSGKYIPEIDGLRFIAILSVLLFHIPGNFVRNVGASGHVHSQPAALGAATGPLAAMYSWTSPAFEFGVEGVLLFFCISGFILSLPFARHYLLGEQSVSLRKYFVRRLTRLEPPYIIAMSALLLGGCALGRFDLTEQLPHFAASLCYLHNIVYGHSSTINNAAWSLEVEVQFYILAPILCWLAFRKRRLACLLLPIAIMGCASSVATTSMTTNTLAKYLHYFLAGVGAGGIYVAKPAWFVSRASWADAGFCAATAAVGLVAHGDRLPRELLLPICFGAMLLCALKSRWISVVLRWPMIAQSGGMCYTTYLYHGRLLTLPIVFIFSRIALTNSRDSDIMLATLLLVPFVFAASIPLFLWFEKPFMNPNWPVEWMQRLRRTELASAESDAPFGLGATAVSQCVPAGTGLCSVRRRRARRLTCCS
ncbi:MAG: acyltransferase [Planctomycetaceae bacterium]